MDACVNFCQSTADRTGEGKYCCDYLDNTRASDNTVTTTDSRGTTTTTTKDYNECWLTQFSTGLMKDSNTHNAYKFKIESTTTDTTTT